MNRVSSHLTNARCGIHTCRVAGWAWAFFVSQKTRNGPRFGPLFGRDGPLRKVRGIEISTRDRRGTFMSIPSLGLSPPFGRSKKSQSVSIRKTTYITLVDRPNMHVVDYTLFLEFASHLRKSAHRKNVFVFECCAFPSFFHGAALSLKRTKKTQGIEMRFFGTPLAHFDFEGGRNFGSGYVSQNSKFYHVMSVSVVPSVSVESVIESVML